MAEFAKTRQTEAYSLYHLCWAGSRICDIHDPACTRVELIIRGQPETISFDYPAQADLLGKVTKMVDLSHKIGYDAAKQEVRLALGISDDRT